MQQISGIRSLSVSFAKDKSAAKDTRKKLDCETRFRTAMWQTFKTGLITRKRVSIIKGLALATGIEQRHVKHHTFFLFSANS